MTTNPNEPDNLTIDQYVLDYLCTHILQLYLNMFMYQGFGIKDAVCQKQKKNKKRNFSWFCGKTMEDWSDN